MDSVSDAFQRLASHHAEEDPIRQQVHVVPRGLDDRVPNESSDRLGDPGEESPEKGTLPRDPIPLESGETVLKSCTIKYLVADFYALLLRVGV